MNVAKQARRGLRYAIGSLNVALNHIKVTQNLARNIENASCEVLDDIVISTQDNIDALRKTLESLIAE